MAATCSIQSRARLPFKSLASACMASDAARSQSAGCCSAWSGSEQSVSKPAAPSPTTSSSVANATTLTAEVPRSTPRVSRRSGVESDMSAQQSRDLVGGRQGPVDIRVGVGKRHEQIFKRARMEQDVALQHALPPSPENLVVGVTGGIAIVADGFFRKPYLQDGSQAHHVGRQAVARENRRQPCVEPRAAGEQRLVL